MYLFILLLSYPLPCFFFPFTLIARSAIAVFLSFLVECSSDGRATDYSKDV